MAKTEQAQTMKDDPYIHGMDWLDASEDLQDFELSRYRRYQFDLIGKHFGRTILEIGSGDRSFTKQIIRNIQGVQRLLSIEPSPTMMEIYKNKYSFPPIVEFSQTDLFDLDPATHGLFDTIVLVHVLEHIQEDRQAVTKLATMLEPGGKILIEVPAMKFLYSGHDDMLGHFRRYNRKNFKAMVDPSIFEIQDLWYQDAIGMMGSLVFFKLLGIRLKSDAGVSLVKNQGNLYDRYVIALETFYEKYVRLPFGLSLTGILTLKS